MSILWTATIAALLLLTTGVAAWWYARRPVPSLNDRYTAQPLIVSEQVEMLDYLTKTFPGQVVVPNVLLRDMLSVRRSINRQQATKRLGDQKVDFVVCAGDGKPLFAFDLEQHHLSDAAAKAYQAKVKNRILKTAGVRLVYVKSSISSMPTPDDFRQQLNMAALPRPEFNRRATDRVKLSPRQKLESYFSEFDAAHSSSAYKESEILDVNDLAELDDMLNRPGSRRVCGGRSTPNLVPSSRSGFGSGTLDARSG